MNKMKEVAALLGVQLNEEFEAAWTTEDKDLEIIPFILKEDGLYTRSLNYDRPTFTDQSWLTAMIAGEVEIIHPPFKPKYEENYWTITSDRDGMFADVTTWTNHAQDYENYYLGLCFRTKEEAEANKDKLIKIINHYKEN